ncbi:MAG: lysophospholipid acyltransferase family protein [Bacteroidia bacterium]|nr:1-acyl-sn-glycerol-3-phosphate acyltransferase [Bacteroidia bacterium]MDW8158768.1 lysophospholipid acyltransferase family protein [Bacteroidia bacterium]
MDKENITKKKLPFLTFLFRRIWSIWFGIWFVGYYILLYPIYYITLRKHENQKNFRIGHWLNKIWGKVILTAALIRVKIIDRAHLDYKQKWIFVSNHRSYLDIPICYVAIAQPFRFIGKAELGKLPLFGFMYRKLHILVERESKMARVKALIAASQKLKEGDSIFIYAEGTSKHPENVKLGEFQDGAFILAIQNQVPIVPVTLLHTEQALSNDGRFLLRPCSSVTVIIDKPIQVQGISMPNLSIIKEQCFQTIYHNLCTYGN